MDNTEDKVYGASGLTDEDLVFHLDSSTEMPAHTPTPTDSLHEAVIPDDDSAIARALINCGRDPDLRHTRQFIVCYNQVMQGPGRHWTPERRTRFTLQTMNRTGALGAEAGKT